MCVCVLSGGSCARRYMAKVSCVENCASYVRPRPRPRPHPRPKLAHATNAVSLPHCATRSILSWCAAAAAAAVTPPHTLYPPARSYCRLSWGSTLALAVIKRLNNASCLIIIYDTRLARLLPEKPACRGSGEGVVETDGVGEIGRRFDLVLLTPAGCAPCDYLNQL